MPTASSLLHRLDPQWPQVAPPPLSGVLRAAPEDFVVEEIPVAEPEGQGEHLWVEVRKRGRNTTDVARALGRWASLPPAAVSFAGLKDRHAVTTQWFSLHLPGRSDPSGPLEADGVEVLRAVRHTRKLQRGALRGNRFRLVVRQCMGDREAFARRADAIARYGVPNYFGAQRFGVEQSNLEQAAAWLEGGRPPQGRERRGMLLSSVRSALFNQVLADRVAHADWDVLLPGEVVMLQGSHSLFCIDVPDAELLHRLASGDLHPTGPLPGQPGKLEPGGVAQAREASVLAPFKPWIAALACEGVAASRRPLRLIPEALEWRWIDATTVVLGFELQAGAYATTVMHELVRNAGEPTQQPA